MPITDHDPQRDMHAMLAFIVPALLSFITVKYKGSPHSPFETHPITMFFFIFALLLYSSFSLPFVARLSAFTTACGARIFHYLMILSFYLSIALPTSLLFPGLSFFLLHLLLLILLFAAHIYCLVQKFTRLVMQKILAFCFVHLRRHPLLGGRAPQILPRTVVDTQFAIEL